MGLSIDDYRVELRSLRKHTVLNEEAVIDGMADGAVDRMVLVWSRF